MLNKVTLTGADDSCDPIQLIEMSKEFPFVEWGILFGSTERQRFPSRKWISNLVESRVNYQNDASLSLHLCGARLRAISRGDPDLEDIIGSERCAFQRVQLNGLQREFGVDERVLSSFCKMDGGWWDPEIIFQINGDNDGLWKAVARRYAVSVLFDRSGGKGITPSEWPAPHQEIPCGWAGGLGPHNVVEEVQNIQKLAWPAMQFWIDMETNLYDEDGRFSLEKCRQVLEAVRPLVK